MWTAPGARALQLASGLHTPAPGVVGFVDVRARIAKASENAPSALARARLAEPIRGLAIAIDA